MTDIHLVPTSLDDGPEGASFGAGGGEPYARALRTDGRLTLTDPERPGEALSFDVGRWNAAADEVDRSLFDDVDGPVIDIGCGPGRMLVAARAIGVPALGVDVSAVAVAIARRSGVRAIRGSVFEPVPEEGYWDTALVIDGNIGIGGDPAALLARCRDIVRVGGRVVVEVDADPDTNRRFTAQVSDAEGHVSAAFPWAEVGRRALVRDAQSVGLDLRRSWTMDDRTFCELTPLVKRS